MVFLSTRQRRKNVPSREFQGTGEEIINNSDAAHRATLSGNPSLVYSFILGLSLSFFLAFINLFILPI
jgi:hypothetical protein